MTLLEVGDDVPGDKIRIMDQTNNIGRCQTQRFGLLLFLTSTNFHNSYAHVN